MKEIVFPTPKQTPNAGDVDSEFLALPVPPKPDELKTHLLDPIHEKSVVGDNRNFVAEISYCCRQLDGVRLTSPDVQRMRMDEDLHRPTREDALGSSCTGGDQRSLTRGTSLSRSSSHSSGNRLHNLKTAGRDRSITHHRHTSNRQARHSHITPR